MAYCRAKSWPAGDVLEKSAGAHPAGSGPRRLPARGHLKQHSSPSSRIEGLLELNPLRIRLRVQVQSKLVKVRGLRSRIRSRQSLRSGEGGCLRCLLLWIRLSNLRDVVLSDLMMFLLKMSSASFSDYQGEGGGEARWVCVCGWVSEWADSVCAPAREISCATPHPPTTIYSNLICLSFFAFFFIYFLSFSTLPIASQAVAGVS